MTHILILLIDCFLQIWVKPEDPKLLQPIFSNLMDLYLSNIFAECDLEWTVYLLEAAPSLKNFFLTVSIFSSAAVYGFATVSIRSITSLCMTRGFANFFYRCQDMCAEGMTMWTMLRGSINVAWEASSGFKHYKLKLLDIGGFETDCKMMKYRRLVMGCAARLRTICLHNKEPCDDCDAMHREAPLGSSFPVDEGDKNLIREHLTDGLSSAIEIIFE